MTTTTVTGSRGRSRLFRAVALAAGALSIAGITLVSAGSSASAAATPAAAPASSTVADHESANLQRRGFCLFLASRWDRSRNCGTRVFVRVRGEASLAGVLNRQGRSCISIGGRPNCAGEDRWAFARSFRGGFDEIALFTEDLRLCGRAGSDGDWGDIECAGRRGVLRLEADDEIDSLFVWAVRGRR